MTVDKIKRKDKGDFSGPPTMNNSTSKNKNLSNTTPSLKEATMPQKEQLKELIPNFDEFLKRTNNPSKKLRHGQGYDHKLGITYVGTFPEAHSGHYGISREKTIRAIHESHDISNYSATDIMPLKGFTDPLTDKTLVQIRSLLEELHNTGKLTNKSISVVAEKLISRSCLYLDFPSQLDRVVYVFWIMGTYMRALFTWYPYICFEGLRDVGKSTALEFLSLTCFNGGGDVSGGYTEADLHKAAASTMGFFAIDHLEERLKSDDKRQVINEFLENAWKLNSYVSKRDQNTGEQLRLYLACSVALGTRRTTETIAEKGLVIRMEETHNNELRKRSITMHKDPSFLNVERDLMVIALQYQDRIKEAYGSINVISGLGREYNKFLPLLAIAKVIDEETNYKTDYFNRLRAYALDYRRERKSEHEDTEELLLRLLIREKLTYSTYHELAKLMQDEGYEKYGWQSAKADINKLKIVKKYDKKKSPIKLYLDLERAKERAKVRGIEINRENHKEKPSITSKEAENEAHLNELSNEDLWNTYQHDTDQKSEEAEHELNRRLLNEPQFNHTESYIKGDILKIVENRPGISVKDLCSDALRKGGDETTLEMVQKVAARMIKAGLIKYNEKARIVLGGV